MKNDEIKKAFESLTPDDAAKERMLRGIMAKSAAMEHEASAEPKAMPWFIRFKAPIGFCAAAMACAMVFTIALSNPAIVQNGSSRQQLLETRPAAETTRMSAIVTTTTAATEAATEAQITTYTTSPLTGGTTAAKSAVTTETVVSTATPPTTEPVVLSSLATETSEALQTTTATETVTTVTTAETVGTTTEVSIKPSLYGDLYDFNLVTWAGRSYATDYALADYSQLSTNLGSGVATGENAEGTYTILLYELKGTPVENGFAVQYAGQTAYYIFYSID